MPTLYRIGAVSIRMYADDHRPPHFHIVAPDFEVLVSLSDFRALEGEARASDIADALKWAHGKREILALKWIELNERG